MVFCQESAGFKFYQFFFLFLADTLGREYVLKSFGEIYRCSAPLLLAVKAKVFLFAHSIHTYMCASVKKSTECCFCYCGWNFALFRDFSQYGISQC
jgi:MoaA/NifB/PqqE/SkfB family radical SAM enzyme